jgi:RNA polymerase sigma factor (sigma-70 family)
VKTDWGEVYRASYQELFRFVHRMVWDEERARDLVQEAFARGMDHDPDKPRAWIFQVAANLARDEARTVVRRKRHLTLLKVEAEVAGDSRDTPAEDLERRERAARVREALDGLSERDRDVILLWDAGLAYEDIADQTGLSKGAIGTTIARAKRKLIEAYELLEDRNAALG